MIFYADKNVLADSKLPSIEDNDNGCICECGQIRIKIKNISTENLLI